MVGRAIGPNRALNRSDLTGTPASARRRRAERRAVRSVEEQQARVAAAAVAPRPVRVAIAEAQGLMCAEEVVTERPLPGFDQAAIDGYAVRSVDVLGVGRGRRPTTRTPTARQRSQPAGDGVDRGGRAHARAGCSRARPRACRPARRCRRSPTRCCRCGGPTAVSRGSGCCAACGPAPTCGAPVTTCSPAMSRCGRARSSAPAQVGLLAAVGRERVLVHPRPRLSVMCVGGELVDISRTPGQRAGLRRQLLRAGRGRPRCGRRGEPGRHRRHRSQGAARSRRGPAQPRRGGGDRGRGRRGRGRERAVGAVAARRDGGRPRIAMHPGSVQGFGQLGRDGVPVFLLPANPVSALVVFEVMVRPLIRLSLGKRQPMRRVVQARTLSPISSVAGRKGYLRGQLMRDQDTGEYLVQALGGAPGAVVASAGDARRGELPGDRAQRRRTDPHRRDRRRRVPGPARLTRNRRHDMNLWRSTFRASGLARAPWGRCGCPPAWCGCGRCGCATRAQWSRIRLGRPCAPGAVGTDRRRGLGSAPCGFVVAVGVFGIARGGPQGPDAAATRSRSTGSSAVS